MPKNGRTQRSDRSFVNVVFPANIVRASPQHELDACVAPWTNQRQRVLLAQFRTAQVRFKRDRHVYANKSLGSPARALLVRAFTASIIRNALQRSSTLLRIGSMVAWAFRHAPAPRRQMCVRPCQPFLWLSRCHRSPGDGGDARSGRVSPGASPDVHSAGRHLERLVQHEFECKRHDDASQ